jgi:uncharacterized protein YxeA
MSHFQLLTHYRTYDLIRIRHLILYNLDNDNVTEHNGVSNEAHAQTQTSQGYHYHYQGYTKSGGEFVLNHTFYNALKIMITL